MDYDPVTDRFLFYHGGETGVIYAIQPNAGNAWDMRLFEFGATSVVPAATPGAGINGRFKYVPAYKGFILLPSDSSNLYFIRTA